uniref:HTH CENPB-type domain-containing protein n=1 Tax=Chlorocebus sabaeus TaxID=60711 RepID=A0A0D9RVA7_CHLSB
TASKWSSERKSCKSLTLNQKLELTKISEEGMSKAEIGKQTSCNAKEKLLKEVKSATPVNIQIIRKRNSFIADMEKVLVVWIKNQNIPLGQDITQRAKTLLNFMKVERGEEATEERLDASRGWFKSFKESSHIYNIKVQGETGNADVEATTSYPENLAKITDEGGYTKQQIFHKKLPCRTFIAGEEKSMPFKASKYRLTVLLAANAAGEFKLKSMLIYHLEKLALKNYAKSTLPVFYKWKSIFPLHYHLFSLLPPCETYYTEKKITLEILLLSDNAPNPRPLMEVYKEINAVFMPAKTTFILHSMNFQVVLKNTFNKAIAILSDSTDLCKGFTFSDTIKNIKDSWEEVKISTLTGIWEKLIPTLMNDFEGFKTSVEDVTAGVVEIARQLELEVEPEAVIELLQSRDKELLLTDKQRKWFIEMESTPGEDAVNIVEMTKKGLECYINISDKAATGFERIDSNFQRSFIVGKMLLNSIAYYREILCEQKSSLMWQTLLLSYFKKLPQPPQPSANTSLNSQQPSTTRQDPPPAKRLQLTEGPN